jgi:predicted GTPase
MPGLGEDIDRDAEHMETYRRILPQCDVALWILKADARAITNVQRSLQELVGGGALDPRRLVVGINQIDLLQPGSWNQRYNIPSRRQEETIQARTQDVREKISRVVAIPSERVVPFSALRGFHLRELLAGMEDAAGRSRAWIIQDLANCMNFENLAEVSDV